MNSDDVLFRAETLYGALRKSGVNSSASIVDALISEVKCLRAALHECREMRNFAIAKLGEGAGYPAVVKAGKR